MTITHDNLDWWKKNASVSADVTEAHRENLEKATKRVFESGSQRDDDTNKPLPNHLDPYLRLRFGYLLRMGGNRYGKGNWRLGQPTETALESLHRHLAKYEMGCREEDHLSAIIFNVMLIMKNEEKDGVSVDNYFKEIHV